MTKLDEDRKEEAPHSLRIQRTEWLLRRLTWRLPTRTQATAPRAPCRSPSGIWPPIPTSSPWRPVELVGIVGWNKSMRCLFWLSLQGIPGNSFWHPLALQWVPDFGIYSLVLCLPVLHLGTAPWPPPTWHPTLQPKWAHRPHFGLPVALTEVGPLEADSWPVSSEHGCVLWQIWISLSHSLDF